MFTISLDDLRCHVLHMLKTFGRDLLRFVIFFARLKHFDRTLRRREISSTRQRCVSTDSHVVSYIVPDKEAYT